MQKFEIRIKNKVFKDLARLPEPVLRKLDDLLRDLAEKGPYRPEWPNYSKLGPTKFHCHLNYSHVACWVYEKDTILIEVYYVGSRQSAPY